MQITNAQIFTHAHKLAKQMKAHWPQDSYRVCFALALRDTYAEIRAHFAAIAAKAAENAAKQAAEDAKQAAETAAIEGDAVAQALVKIGCTVWQNKRIYANYQAATIFANYNDFGRGRKSQLHEAYYDLTDHTWHDNWIGKLNAEFAA